MIAFNLVGTKKDSGTKTFNINFFNEINHFDKAEGIIVFISKFYLLNENLKLSDKIKIIVKPDLFDNFVIRFIWMQFFLPFELKAKKVKVLFSSSNYSPFLLKLFNIKSVLFIHTVLPWLYFDLIPGNKFKNFIIKKIMEISIFSSKSIIVPSNYAKINLVNKLNIEPKKVHVINLGANHIFEKKNDSIQIKNFDYNQKYILSVISCVRYGFVFRYSPLKSNK